MATITSAASGLASAGSTWVGGIVPVEGDKVIIAAGHVVTLDGTFTWGDDSVTATLPNAAINVYGTLKASRLVNSSLTGKGLILCNYGTQGIDFGTEADPLPSGITAELVLNKATTPAIREGLRQVTAPSGTANYILNTFWSADTRVRGVKLAAQATAGDAVISLESYAHNWRVGDELMFMKTSSAALDDTETRTIASISGADITLSSALTYTHLNALPICNLTCDITIRSFNQVVNQTASIVPGIPGFVTPATLGYYWKFRGVAFQNLASAASGANHSAFGQSGFGSPPTNKCGVSFESCSFKLTIASGTSFLLTGANAITGITDFVILTSGQLLNGGVNFRITRLYAAVPGTIFSGTVAWTTLTDCYISGRYGNSTLTGPNSLNTYTRCYFFGVSQSVLGDGNGQTRTKFVECDFGYTFEWGARSGGSDRLYRLDDWMFRQPSVEMVDCLFGSALAVPYATVETVGGKYSQLSPLAETAFYNKNQDATAQEIYYGSHTLRRDNSVKNRGLSSISIKPVSVGADTQRTQSIPCANGATIRVVGYVRMDTAYWNAGDNNLPTVTLTGLGATPVTFTASAAGNNAWEQFDLSITNTSGADGNFTLTYTANAKTVSTGTIYFDGVPDSPFITKVRHYGFLFNETSPTREVNPYTVATESVAAAYTGTTINATTKRVTFGIGTADTLAKVYDYSQAWAVTNIDKEVPWTRAGALLSLTSGWTVVDPAIAGVTWGGGTIEWNTPGAITGSFDSTTFRFNSAGTYDLSGGTFAGTINLTNTSGGGVIVIVLPGGIDYVNDDPGSITVEVAVESATASITNIVPGSRLQVYNVTEDTEMVNTIVAGTSWTASYPNGTGYSTGDVVRVRLAWHSGATAKLPVQYQTVAASGGWSILADQVDDTVYNYNAIDGDSCTEFSHDFANVQVDVDDADNTTTVQRGYAWFIAGQMTADGIRYFFGGITAEDSVNYRINAALVNLRIQNIKAGSNLTVTGGNIYRTDDTDIFAPGASGSTASMRYGRAYTVRVGGGTGLSPEESAKLMSLPSAATVATAVDASTVLAKEATALAARNNAALAAAVSA